MKKVTTQLLFWTATASLSWACASVEDTDAGDLARGTGGQTTLPGIGGNTGLTGSGGNTSASGGAGSGSGGLGGAPTGSGGMTGVDPDVLANADVVVYLQNTSGSVSGTPSMKFFIENKSDDPLAMANVKVRYWFTPDGNTPAPVSYYNGGSVGAPTWALGADGDEAYLQASFASGSVIKNGDRNATEFQLQINGGTYDQSNDYSYAGVGTPTATDKVTLYLADKLIWGCEPSGTCAGDDEGPGGSSNE